MKLFHQIWPQLRPPLLNITTNHRQTRPPNPTIRTDHHCQTRQPIQIRSPHQITDRHPWLFSFQAAQHNQHSEMVQVRCIPYGLGQGGYIELWMNLAKHTFHTRSAWSFRTLFRLKLIVVRLASGFPGLVRASPSLFHKLGSFAGVRSAVSSASRNRLGFFGFGFDSRKRFGSVFLRLFKMDYRRLCRRRRRRLHFRLPLSCAKFELIYHTSLDSLCAGQVKLSFARFNQTVIILGHNLVN